MEHAAVGAHLQLVAWTLLPAYYVFDNVDVLTTYDVLPAGSTAACGIAGSRSSTGGRRRLISVAGNPPVDGYGCQVIATVNDPLPAPVAGVRQISLSNGTRFFEHTPVCDAC
ncbi:MULTISPECIES: hypothetical protein [unclassified Streptomyces]|uniref:hypothetical protein n=1 Tax=unclassified Streptomyces TaxID=2593676 RepID=UPI0019426A19|nr:MULTISPECIES: hypothetical protein [unclassified Streptomyces]